MFFLSDIESKCKPNNRLADILTSHISCYCCRHTWSDTSVVSTFLSPSASQWQQQLRWEDVSWGQRHEDDDMRRTTSRTTTWGWWRLRGRQWRGRWHGRHPRGQQRKWHRRQMASMARRQRQASTANGIDSKWHGRQTTTTTDMRRTTRMDDDD